MPRSRGEGIQCDDRVEDLLDPFVFEGSSAEDGIDLVGDDPFADDGVDLIFGDAYRDFRGLSS